MNFQYLISTATSILSQHNPLRKPSVLDASQHLAEFTQSTTNLSLGASLDPVSIHQSLRHGDFRTWFEVNRDYSITINNSPAILKLKPKELATVLQDPTGQLKFVASIAATTSENLVQHQLVSQYSDQLSNIINSKNCTIECLTILSGLNFPAKNSQLIKTSLKIIHELSKQVDKDALVLRNNSLEDYKLYTAMRILTSSKLLYKEKVERVVSTFDKKLEEASLDGLRIILLPSLIDSNTFTSQVFTSGASYNFFKSHSDLKRHILIKLFTKSKENADAIYSMTFVKDFVPLGHMLANFNAYKADATQQRLFDLGAFYGLLLTHCSSVSQVKLRYAIIKILGLELAADLSKFSDLEVNGYNKLNQKLLDSASALVLVRALEADKEKDGWPQTLTRIYKSIATELDIRDFKSASTRIKKF